MNLKHLDFRTRGLAFLILLGVACGTASAGCASTVTVLNDAGGDGSNGNDAGATSDGGGSTDAGVVSDGGVACGATTCASGQACCAQTGRCYDPGCLSCCMPMADAGGGGNDAGGARVCTSASDCDQAAGEGCLFAAAGCGITGVCGPVTNACGRALGSFCSCDGQTFLESCSGPDRPWVHQGACHTPCLTDNDCLSDQSCCTATGQCYASGCLSCCMPPADAGTRTCTQASQCDQSANEDCIFSNPGCGITGVCAVVYACGRPSLPYCGCDGQTFFDTCAGPDRTWVSSGECPTTDGGVSSGDAGGGVSDGGVITGDAGIGVGDGGVITNDAGVPVCRSNADCGSGQNCCPLSGRCYDPACLACCM